MGDVVQLSDYRKEIDKQFRMDGIISDIPCSGCGKNMVYATDVTDGKNERIAVCIPCAIVEGQQNESNT